jgi:ketosteroid isomerase-like protein
MKLLLIPIVMAAVSARLVAQQCSDAEKAKLEEFDKAWTEAAQRGDRTRLQAMFADDFASTELTGSQDKTTTIDATVRAAERARATGQTPPPTTSDNYIIACTPVSAVITHRAATTTTVNGREQTSYFRSVHMLEKRGGRWQLVGNAGHALNDAGVLLYMQHDWTDASKRKDMAWFERIIADVASGISSRTGAIKTKSQAIESMRSDKSVIESIELLEPTVRVEGDAAVLTGINRVRGRDEQGKPFDRRTRFTGTYIKRDRRWQVWAFQGTVIP